MTFKDMYYLQTLAACGSYSRAAERLYISQPALSQTIRKLEESYHTKIFEYRARRLNLTESGKILLESAGRMYGIAEQIQSHFDQRAVQEPPISIVFAHHMESMFENLCDIVAEEGIVVRAFFVYKNWWNTRQWDLRFSISKRPPAGSLVLATEGIGCLVTEDHPLAEREYLAMKDLEQYPLVMPPGNTGYRSDIQRIFLKSDAAVTIRTESDNYASYPDFLQGTDHIALVPTVSAGLQHKEGFRMIPWKDYPEGQKYRICLEENPMELPHPRTMQILEIFRRAL